MRLNPLGPAASAHRSHWASPCSRSSARHRLTVAATRSRKCARGSNGQAPAFTAVRPIAGFQSDQERLRQAQSLAVQGSRASGQRSQDHHRTDRPSCRPDDVETTSPPQDTMQRDRLGKEHLDLLSLPTSDDVGLGLDDCARLVVSGFMNGARDLTRWHVRSILA